MYLLVAVSEVSVKIHRKREMRRAMQKGHSPSKAVSIADALHRKAQMAEGAPSNVETVNPKTGTAGDQEGNLDPAAVAKHGMVTAPAHDKNGRG
jgi:hypothetical protein